MKRPCSPQAIFTSSRTMTDLNCGARAEGAPLQSGNAPRCGTDSSRGGSQKSRHIGGLQQAYGDKCPDLLAQLLVPEHIPAVVL